MQLEGLTGMIPMLLVFGVNAKVSADRIDKFLQRPEKPENTYPGESISFNKATVSFPSESQKEDEDRFILRDISLDFPNGALSVISGPTGSGKSLLLAAILGEAEGEVQKHSVETDSQAMGSSFMVILVPASLAVVAHCHFDFV